MAPEIVKRPSGRNRRTQLAVAAVLGTVLVVGALVALIAGGGQRAASPSAGHRVATAVRTLLVGAIAADDVSRPDGPLVARPVRGAVPAGTSEATVLTDEDCAPDAKGVSHCLNKLRFEDGSTLTVRHPHRMADVPCLSPGERVRVRSS